MFYTALITQVTFVKAADFGIAQQLAIQDKNVRPGDIVSAREKGFFISKIEYDQSIIGVISDNPAVSFESSPLDPKEKRYYVVNSGISHVNVSTINGAIKKGDYITSSNIPGIGMRATKTGFILGSSLEDYSAKDPKVIKKLNVVLNPHNAVSQTTVKKSLIDVGNLSIIAWSEEPLTVLRYLLAGLVLIFSIVLAFYTFGRVASRGVEALGRNPLAARVIELGIVLNVIITVAIIAAGIIVAILILTI